jgi:LPXTG-motif cell wall-anchored protein
MNARTATKRMLTILAVGAIGLAFTVRMTAQVQTSTSTEHLGSTQEVKVVNAVVVTVDGNNVVVKMEDGSIRHLENVPESARATVDGREIGVHELKPGMHLSKTITTTSTPKVITTTQTVTGKVWHVNPPQSVILTLDDGTNQQFKIPKGQKFMVNGQETDAWGLKKGMKVSATKIVEEPITVVEQRTKLAGHAAPPPPAPAADQPILIAVATPAPAAPAAAPEAAPAALPKTGSDLPLIGLFGMLLLAAFGAVRLFRTARN